MNLSNIFTLILITIFVMLLLSFIKIINQFERGVVLTLGKFSGIREPGLELAPAGRTS